MSAPEERLFNCGKCFRTLEAEVRSLGEHYDQCKAAFICSTCRQTYNIREAREHALTSCDTKSRKHDEATTSKQRRKRRGCSECHRRRLKCGKERPECSNCRSFARACDIESKSMSQQNLADWKDKPSIGDLESAGHHLAPESRPTYIRCQMRHLLPETLDAYQLPWETDPDDAKYVFIKQYIDEDFQRRLFEHTKRIYDRQKAQHDDFSVMKFEIPARPEIPKEKIRSPPAARSRHVAKDTKDAKRSASIRARDSRTQPKANSNNDQDKARFVRELVERFVVDLINNRIPLTGDCSNLAHQLDELIEEFAGRQETPTAMSRGGIDLVRLHIRDIASCLFSLLNNCMNADIRRDHTTSTDDEGRSVLDENKPGERKLSKDEALNERIERWILDATSEYLPEESALDSPVQGKEVSHTVVSICTGAAYAWFLSATLSRLRLTANCRVKSEIRQAVLETMTRKTVADNGESKHYEASFDVAWSPMRALDTRWRSYDSSMSYCSHFGIKNEEGFLHRPSNESFSLRNIVTITGESSKAQALTCSEYFTQVWPSTGSYTLQLIEDIISRGHGEKSNIERPDGSSIVAWLDDSDFIHARISGLTYAIAEFAEQLAWLGAALGDSPWDQGIALCTATISPIHNPKTKDSSPLADYRNDRDTSEKFTGFGFRLDFDFDYKASTADTPSPGTCWQTLFQNPVIVKGFPILSRRQWDLGLEINLNVVAGLLGTNIVNTFHSQVFLKGYSTIAYPTVILEDLAVWHLECDSSKQYMPYPSREFDELSKLSIHQIAGMRHIIGWCQSAMSNTGLADGSYKTQRCKLGPTTSSGIFNECMLNFGSTILGGMPYTLLDSHNSLQFRRKTYFTMLNYLSTKFMVLWDVKDQRGWLVNGVNALYHILRSSLKGDEVQSARNPNSSFVLRPGQLVEPKHPGTASVAREFLDNKINLSTPISLSSFHVNNSFSGGTSRDMDHYELLAHRLEQFHDALEILINYQEQAEARDSSHHRSERRSRAIYEGWDFVDLTRRQDQTPRMMRLPLDGLACVDFLRSIRAVTLFGNRFGELISPSAETCCVGWQTLPRLKHYIAGTIADIEKLIEEEGDDDSGSDDPPLFSCTTKIMWYTPQALIDQCGCSTGDSASTRLVQVPWPRKYRRLLKNSEKPERMSKGGAIILGYNELVTWHWAAFGEPIPGPPPKLDPDDSDDDSGIGSSISTAMVNPFSATSNQSGYLTHESTGNAQRPSVDQAGNIYGGTNVNGGYVFLGNTYQITNNHQHTVSSRYGDGLHQPAIHNQPRNFKALR